MNHKHHDVICAMARGEKVEFRLSEKWIMWHEGCAYSPFDHSDLEWRIVPKVLSINGMEFPAPVPPGSGGFYVRVSRECGAATYFYHYTDEARKAHFDAILRASTP